MGNGESNNKKLENEEESEYLTRDEIASLKRIFSVLKMDKLSVESVSSIFGSSEQALFSECIYYWMVKNITDYKSFQQFMIDCTRVEPNKIVKTMWKILLNHPKVNSENRVQLFFTLTLVLAFPEGFNNSPSTTDTEENTQTSKIKENATVILGTENDILFTAQRMTEFYQNSMLKVNPSFTLSSPTECNFSILSGWINNYAPYTSRVFESYISLVVYRDALSPSFHPFMHPTLRMNALNTLPNHIPVTIAATSSIVNECDVSALALFSDNLQDEWTRLYNSANDGTSFNRIVHHILGYEGPTVILIKCTDPLGTVLGAFSADRWKENNKFYGSSNNLLFTLKPKVRIYRSKGGGNQAYQYLNTKSYANPHGLGLGGSVDGFRLWIPESLEHCIASGVCPTYEPGRLIEGDKFEIDSIEIWGCGGKLKVNSALEAQVKEREIVNESIRRARKVDKAAFFNNAFDREFILGGTFSHQSDRDKRGGV